VLDILLAHVLKGVRDPVAEVVTNRARDADAAGRRQALQPRRDIDAVAIYVVAVGDDVAQIDPNAKAQAAQRTASTTLTKSARSLSPVVLTIRP
jgi:hypothetical protein